MDPAAEQIGARRIIVSKLNRSLNDFVKGLGRASLVMMIVAASAAGVQSARARQSTTGNVATGKTANQTPVEQSPLYCNVKALSKAEWDRHLELSSKIGDATVETKERADGYAFRLRTDGVSLAEVAEWTMREQRCCPFFDFQIELQREGGPLWFKLTGREGVKQFILNEFKRFRLK